MNRPIQSICLMLAAGLALSLAQAAPGRAQDAMKNAIDCSNADSMMTVQAHPSAQVIKPSGNIDQDFAQTITVHNNAMMAMVKAEVACGKDAKTKAMAQKLLDQATANAAELQTLLAGGR